LGCCSFGALAALLFANGVLEGFFGLAISKWFEFQFEQNFSFNTNWGFVND
jgi:hypothetical protein